MVKVCVSVGDERHLHYAAAVPLIETAVACKLFRVTTNTSNGTAGDC